MARHHPSPWYRDGRFRNLDGLDVPGDMGPGAVLKWKLSRRAPAEDPQARDVPARPIAPFSARGRPLRRGPAGDWLATFRLNLARYVLRGAV